MNEVIKYKNEFLRLINLGNMDALALNMFGVLLHKLVGIGNQEVKITFKDFNKLSRNSESSNISNNELQRYLNENIVNHIGAGAIRYISDERSFVIPLFSFFDIDNKKETIRYAINPKMYDYFNDFLANFTVLELAEFTGLKSKYAKLLYQKLKQYRKKGHYNEEYDSFIYDILSVPKGYAYSNVGTRIIKPALEEIKKIPVFKDLKISYKKYGKRYGRIFFDWTPEPEKRFFPNNPAFIPADNLDDPNAKEQRELDDIEWAKTILSLRGIDNPSDEQIQEQIKTYNEKHKYK